MNEWIGPILMILIIWSALFCAFRAMDCWVQAHVEQAKMLEDIQDRLIVIQKTLSVILDERKL